MQPYEVGQIRGRYRDGVLVDRGRVVRVRRSTSHGVVYAKTVWECGGQTCDDERVLQLITGTITYRDLEDVGIRAVEFRCGGKGRRSHCAWSISESHKRLLRSRLEAQGFDVTKDIAAIEMPSGEDISLIQEVPRCLRPSQPVTSAVSHPGSYRWPEQQDEVFTVAETAYGDQRWCHRIVA
jgi:hypothetical protein